MLEQSSVELENTIGDLEEKNEHVEDEGNNSVVFIIKAFLNLFRYFKFKVDNANVLLTFVYHVLFYPVHIIIYSTVPFNEQFRRDGQG